MRRFALPLLGVLVAALVWSAAVDPSTHFLLPEHGLTWWVDPEPLATMHAEAVPPLRFTFTPARAGRLELAASGTLSIEGPHPTLALPASAHSWKRRRVELEVAAEPYTVVVRSAFGVLPALGIGGEAAPAAVQIARGERPAVAASRAGDLLAVRPALHGVSLHLARLAFLALVAAVAATLLPARRPLPAPPGTARRDWRLAIVGAHALLAAWNVAGYPAERGLDAREHLEVARITLAERRVPAPERSFQAYHPPLHAVLAALALAVHDSPRALQALSALAGLGLVVIAARTLGPSRPRGLLLVAALPALLVAEPQPTNEVVFALLATATLAVAGGGGEGVPGGAPSARRAAAAGGLAGLALLTKYTGVFPLAGAVAAPLLAGGTAPVAARTRARAALITLAVALAVGGGPLIQRALRYGDPFVGNWDDALGFPYRQPPGFRTPAYFLRFGASLVAHPFRAREASLWDSLYVSTFGDGFGRFVATPVQHALLGVLAWAALPLALVALRGALALAGQRERPSRLEAAAITTAILAVAGVVRFNLELPYWSAAKGVFLLGLSLPLALAFERGRDEVVRRFGRRSALLLDAALVGFSIVSAVTFVYRE